MKIIMTRMASLLLAFGFFFITACSSTVHTLESAENQFNSENHQRALSTVNEVLRDEPGNSDARILKGKILVKLAENQEHPDNRTNYYLEMEETLAGIESTDIEIIEAREELKTFAWQMEFDQGETLLNRPLTGDDADNILSRAARHFENALIFQPDNPAVYNNKASAHYRNGELHHAIETLNSARERFETVPRDMIEKLAFLLLEEGQIKSSIELYRELLQSDPGNEQLKHGLVNAYILDEQHQKSIELLKELVEIQPDHLAYNEALATELFFHIQSTITGIDEEEISEQELQSTLDDLMDDLELAEENYNRVRENHPDPGEITFITAAFYKNTAGQLLNLANQKSDELSDRLQNKAHDLLNASIPIWNTLAVNNPENTEIWRSLYQIYTQLDMTDEAEEARRNANL